MLTDQEIAVVIPAYNESRLIEKTMRSIPDYVDLIVVVDDGSEDDTASRATAAADPRVRVLRHDSNRGVGAAIGSGYRLAFDSGAAIAVVMAGDAQMDPRDLTTLLRPLVDGEAHYAKGDRLSWPCAHRMIPPLRWVGNQILSAATRLATGLAIRDSQCGYTALHREAATRLDLGALWSGYGYTNDLLSQLSLRRLRVVDVPVRPIYEDEQSGLGWRHALFVIPFVVSRAALRRIVAAAGDARRRLPTMGRA